MAKENEFYSPDEVLDYERQEEALDPDYQADEPEVSEKDSDIVEMFNANKAKMENHWNDIYAQMEDDWAVYNLDQWTADTKMVRSKRPTLTVDISRKFVKSVVAETFRNPPSVKLSARTDSVGDKAKYISEAIRYFEDRTGAIYAYSHAKECAAVGGIGWIKVAFRNDDQQAMPAVLDVDRVDDPLSIMIDPDSRELDGSDALYGMEVHGKCDGEEKFTYWWKDAEGLVKWALISGNKVEDKASYPTRDIPLVPVYGEVYNIRSNFKCFGIIRQLTDTQRSYNYAISEAVERLALTPKSPITAVQGSIPEQYQKDWGESMTQPKGILWWNNLDENGQPTIPMPTRNETTPDVSWVAPLMQALQATANETTGIFPDSYGARNSAESGVAIKARMDSADRGQLIYDEHLQISVKQVGSLLLDMLEPVITPAGILPIMGEDGTTGTKMIGEATPMVDEQGNPMPLIDPATGQPVLDQMGNMIPAMNEPELPDLDVTDLEISISSAPAYATRKQEGLDSIKDMLPMMPPDQQAALVPTIIRDLDFPGADEYANVLSPDPSKMDPMAMQSQIADLQGQLEQSNMQAQELANQNQQLNLAMSSNLTATLQKAQIDNQTKIAIEEMKQQGQFVKTQMDNQADAVSDDKKLMADANKTATSNQMKAMDTANTNQATAAGMQNSNQQLMAKLAADAESDNKKLALEAQKMQQNMISKVEVQPVAIVDNRG